MTGIQNLKTIMDFSIAWKKYESDSDLSIDFIQHKLKENKHESSLGIYCLRGKIEEAKKLVSETFSLETCKDYSLLNLLGYIKLFEKDYKEALLIYQKYLEIAISSQDKEMNI